MKLSETTKSCWKTFAFVFFIEAIFLLFLNLFFDLEVIIVAVIVIAFCHIFSLSKIKSELIKGLSFEAQYSPSNPEEFSQLDRECLEKYTTDLEALGFTRIFDCKFETTVEGSEPEFIRYFSHPQRYCFAVIDQLFSSGEAQVKMKFSIVSVLTDDWTLFNSTRRIAQVLYVGRRPNNLWISCPDATPQEMLESHIQKRQEMIDVLGVQPHENFSLDIFIEYENKSLVALKRAWKRKNLILGLIEATLFELNPPSEWMGDYKRIAKQTARMG